MVIENWSIDKNYTGHQFRIERINYDEIAVSSPGIKSIRSVSRADFEKLSEHWDGYKGGRLPRTEVAVLSRNSTYIFGIFRLLEQHDD
jgi:hypothetical protein